MKPMCIIAARGGSKGVPRKNIRMLGNKPLIAHTIELCQKSKIFQSVIVTTEDQEIAKISMKYGAEVPFMRPNNLATDNTNMDDVLLHSINQLNSLGYDFETIVSRDCTVPFINIKDIKKSIKILNKNKCDLVCGVYKQHHNPYFNMMEINKKGYLEFSKKLKKRIQSRQSSPDVFQLNGLFTLNALQFKKFKKFYMPKILPCKIPPERGFMIDTEFEFQIAELIVKNKIII